MLDLLQLNGMDYINVHKTATLNDKNLKHQIKEILKLFHVN
jgi:3-oxoacyl-(acyl-carrier-protein) synthase